MNEFILIISLIIEYSAVLLAYRFFGKTGLFAITAFCTVAANIEVMILVNAFGIEQTLGNVLFACSFLVTDILSENEGKEAANKAVNLGICISIFFIIVSQSWMLYQPASADVVMPAVRTLFANTPRVMIASILIYAVTQRLDVWLYHKWWALTDRKGGDHKKFLWLRNNGSTLISQLINAFLFNFAAFWGIYPTSVVISISLSSYLIYIVTSLCDTPVVYAARYMKRKNRIKNN